MKTILALLAILVAPAAFADVTNVCQRFFVCQTFEGTGGPIGAAPTFRERTTFSATGNNTGVIDLAILEMDGKVVETYHLEVTFLDDGEYTMMSKGHLYARGICNSGMCTYGMEPFVVEEGLVGNTGILRFGDRKLERYMFVIVPGKVEYQLSNLKPTT